MQALSNVEILERALAKARANNPDWKPLVLGRAEDLIQMGHENMGLFNRGFALAFGGKHPTSSSPLIAAAPWSRSLISRRGGTISKNLPWPRTSSRIWPTSYEPRPRSCVQSLSRLGSHACPRRG